MGDKTTPALKNNSAKPKGRGGARSGAGRKPGVPNKVTTELKEMILQALAGAGGVEYLQTQADKNPASFLTLIGKVLPMQVAGAGKDGEIVHRIILEGVAAK
jgi:hypothetical protein